MAFPVRIGGAGSLVTARVRLLECASRPSTDTATPEPRDQPARARGYLRHRCRTWHHAC